MPDQVLPNDIFVNPWFILKTWLLNCAVVNENIKDENERQFSIRNMALGSEITQLEFCVLTQKNYWVHTLKTERYGLFSWEPYELLGNKSIRENMNKSKVLHDLGVKGYRLVSTRIQWQGWSMGAWHRGRCQNTEDLGRPPKVMQKVSKQKSI